VAALVAEQFPQWAGLPLRRVAGDGTVNAVFRLGDDLSVRLPLRADDPEAARRWLAAEAEACRELADGCPFPAPVPVALGEPGHGYPLPWAVQTWLAGRDATVEDPADSDAFAADLVTLLGALREMDTRGRRFAGRRRGDDLTTHDDWVEECLGRSERLVDVPRCRSLWTSLRTLPRPGADVMSHSDLVPGDVLVRDGRLAGVLEQRRLRPGGSRARPRVRPAPAGRRPPGAAAPRAGVRGGGVAARHGVGARAGPRSGLVPPRGEPGAGRDGAAHDRPAADRAMTGP
jgi:aminoglycoside phosphotransferase (APT) family kinase protein